MMQDQEKEVSRRSAEQEADTRSAESAGVMHLAGKDYRR